MQQVADEARERVWFCMAEHFLDTETRQSLPGTALVCLEAGYDAAQLGEIWRDEVTPALAFNLLSVAGEWAYWDRAWLTERVARQRRGGAWSWLRRALRVDWLAGPRESCERFARLLSEFPPSERRAVSDELGAMAQHYFDFMPEPLRARRCLALRARFLEAALPATVRGEHQAALARLDQALAQL